MIGDTKYDLIGANENKISAVGISYGYGPIAELENESPLAIISSLKGITSFFKNLGI